MVNTWWAASNSVTDGTTYTETSVQCCSFINTGRIGACFYCNNLVKSGAVV